MALSTFRPWRSARLYTYALTVLGPGSILFVMLFKGYSWSDVGLIAVSIAVPLALCGLYLSLELGRARVVLDQDAIARVSLFKTATIRWPDITDAHFSPRLISLVSATGRKRLKFFRSEGRYSFEPFDRLQHEIQRQVADRLERTWDGLRLPVVCTSSGLLSGTIVGYVFVTGLAVLFPSLIAFRLEGFGFEKAVLFAATIAPILPFFVRDYRRAHRILTVEQDGLRQRNGREVFLSWSSISEIVVREPLEVGYGTILVRNSDGMSIRISRSLTNIGAVCHLLKKNTNVVETYGHES